MMRIKNILLLIIILATMSSCASVKEIFYFQDIQPDIAEQVTPKQPIRIHPGDKISIMVISKDAQMAATFNLQSSALQAGNTGGNSERQYGYTVDSQGEINFPVLGRIRVENMTKEELAVYIENELIKRNLLKDPIIITEFQNLTVSVIGEVNNPGRFNIEKDNITLLEVLSMAGDLTIYGNRKRVVVMRAEEGKQVSYCVDLRSARQLYVSPVYYLQQNDVVYVEPNSMRARQSTVNGNSVHSVPFWMSLTSFLTTISIFVFK